MENNITGEDVAALLHGIHEHMPDGTTFAGKIVYYEEDLLPILEALGLPAPVWGKSMSVEEFKKQRS